MHHSQFVALHFASGRYKLGEQLSRVGRYAWETSIGSKKGIRALLSPYRNEAYALVRVTGSFL